MIGAAGKFFDFADRIHRTQTTELSEAAMAVDAAAAKLCTGLSEEQLSWRPRPGSWSIAQNLAHLRTTTELFLPAVDCAMEASRKLKLQREGPFRLSLHGRLLVWRLGARPVIKMRAPKLLLPQLLSSSALELEHFLISQGALRQRIADANSLDLTALQFPSPIDGYFRVNLLEFFSACNAHSQRHLWQANNVRRMMSAKLSEKSYIDCFARSERESSSGTTNISAANIDAK